MPSNNFVDTRILVCMYKIAGEDSYATVIPRDGRLAELNAFRPNIQFNGAALIATALDATWALHPALSALLPLWSAGDIAIHHRVGTQWDNLESTPIADVRAATQFGYSGPLSLPGGLGGHDQQQYMTASGITRDFTDSNGVFWSVRGTGVLGRIATRFLGFNGESPLPTVHQTGGGGAVEIMSSDGLVKPISVPGIGGRFARNPGGNAVYNQWLTRFDRLLPVVRSDARDNTYAAVGEVTRLAAGYYDPIVSGTGFGVDADFTTGGPWQGQLQVFARAIERRAQGDGLPKRLVVMVGTGDYDTHAAQGQASGRLADLHYSWSQAVSHFKAAMVRLGLWNQTLMFDISDFGRTIAENGGAGTDHAWARTAFVIGGVARGLGREGSSGYYGTAPTVYGAGGGGSHDVGGGEIGSGALVPGMAYEQYLENPLRWIGCNDADLAYILPRRSTFGAAVQNVIFVAPPPPPMQPGTVLTISANANSINLWDLAQAPSAPGTYTFEFARGVDIGSDTPAAQALNVGNWPVGCTVVIRGATGGGANPRISGAGGVGALGKGDVWGNWWGQPGNPGGVAINARGKTVQIFLANLEVYGGGGGGGGGGRSDADNSGGGGGGAGIAAGVGGLGGFGNNANGSAGTRTTGGAGYSGGNVFGSPPGFGGAGGAPGMAGTAGANTTWQGGGAGGAPGASVLNGSATTYPNGTGSNILPLP